ncbi:MAG: phage/plasmid primase, P4 family [Verrucomicrobiota bacterium]
MNIPELNTIRQPRELDLAHTCNEVAAVLFPEAAKTSAAFVELELEPLSISPKLQLVDLLDDFWALTLKHTVFVSQENQFRQYQPSTGIYAPVQESTLIGQVITNLNQCAEHFPSRLKFESFLLLKNRQRLRGVVERAKDLLAEDGDDFFKPKSPHLVHLANGVLNVATRTFTPFSPSIPLCHTLPVKYDPAANCELFLSAFLEQILSPDDIDLLQRYASQILLGTNQAQKILGLTGCSGWGKSTLMKILGTMLGWNRVGIIREQLYSDGSELKHYANKHFLYHPDMPTQFLNRKESSVFKQLVGSDPLWADARGGEERLVLEGTFPVILACNGKPQICIDQDVEAWARRLVILTFKKPTHDKHMGRLAEGLMQEMSGILNWLLDGYAKLLKSSQQLTQTQEQQTRSASILLGSESPRAYVRNCLVKRKDGVVGIVELYENYQLWCRQHHLQPFSSRQFNQIAKTELEIELGLKYRHDLPSENGGWMRGWKGLAMVEAGEVQNAKNASVESEVLVEQNNDAETLAA